MNQVPHVLSTHVGQELEINITGRNVHSASQGGMLIIIIIVSTLDFESSNPSSYPGGTSKVPPPTDEDWTLETAEAVGVLKRKKNWSAPGPDRLVNFWLKRVHVLHEGVPWSFEAISRSDDEYPSWFAEGKNITHTKTGRVH